MDLPAAKTTAPGRPATATSWRLAWATVRARQWRHFVLLPAAAIDPAALATAEAGPVDRTLRAGIAAALVLGYAYGLNAVADRASDRDAGKNPLAGGECPPLVQTWLGAWAVAACALALTNGAAAGLAAAAAVVAATVYSVGPRLKAVPVAGTLLNAAIFAPLLLLALPATSPSPSLAVRTAVFLVLLLQNQLLHELADGDEDRRGGVRTTARWLGPVATRRLAGLVGIAGALAVPWLATTPLEGSAAAAALLAGSAVAARGGDDHRRRIWHRGAAIGGGAALWLCGGLL